MNLLIGCGWFEIVESADISTHGQSLDGRSPTSFEGHDYTVTARYDNSKPLDDVMGIVLAYVWRGTQ